jgi:hypothetical protein
MIKQLSVFIENKPGRLSEVTGYLSEAGVNLHAVCLADTTDYGVLRLIVDDPEKALRVLKEHGLAVKITEVVGAALTHQPGSLSGVLRSLEKAGVSIEYMYAFTSRSSVYDAIVVFRLTDQEKVMERLEGVPFIGSDEIGRLNA